MQLLLSTVTPIHQLHASNAGGDPAPVEVNTCPSLPVAIATGSPEASKLIIFPSVPPASLAKVIALSALVRLEFVLYSFIYLPIYHDGSVGQVISSGSDSDAGKSLKA